VPADVGVLWFATGESGTGPRVWVYDIVIHEQFQRRGYGAQTLKLLEEGAEGLGANRVDLHVFGHNHEARKLYEASGHEVTALTMTRTLPGYVKASNLR
jgi:GNAT superfamily N-acetyltransferase